MIKIANHRPLFDVEQISSQYEEDGVPVRYICTTDFNASDVPVDVYYRGKIPHPKFGNRYFGLYFDHYRGCTMIMNADSVEELTFGMIEHEGEYYYSRSHHDFVQVTQEKIIDGGRKYYRYSTPTVTVMKIKDGNFYVEEVVEPLSREELRAGKEQEQSDLGSQ